jgi:hypothetical protein
VARGFDDLNLSRVDDRLAPLAARKSLLAGIFTGIFGKNAPPGGFFDLISPAFSVSYRPKSLLGGTGIFAKPSREFLSADQGTQRRLRRGWTRYGTAQVAQVLMV